MMHINFILTALGAISIKASETGLPTSTTTISQGLANIVGILVWIIGSISVVMIVVGGLMYAVSSGDPGRIKRARDTITYAVVGVVVSIIAYAVVTYIAGALKT